MSKKNNFYIAIGWTGVANFVRIIIQLSQIIILTRLLTPSEYGGVTILLMTIAYFNIFSDMGLSSAFIQKKEITFKERSSLYWFGIFLGFVIMLISALLVPFITYFFNAPEIFYPLIILSTNFLTIQFAQQLRLNAEKSINFRISSIIEIISSLSGFILLLVMIFLDFGIYSIVFSSLLNAWVVVILSWIYLSDGWRPFIHFEWTEVKGFLRFGLGVVSNNIINTFNGSFDLILVGKIFGTASLGIYSLPRNIVFQIQNVINPIFTRVGFPLISAAKDNKIEVTNNYMKIIRFTALLNSPIYVSIFFYSEEICQLLLGDKFHLSSPLLQILAIWGLIRSFFNPLGALLFGMGFVRKAFFWNLFVTFFLSVILLIGVKFGINGVAWAMVISYCIIYVPGWYFLVRPLCEIGFWRYLSSSIIQGGGAFLSIGSTLMLVNNFFESWQKLAFGLILGLCCYLLLLSLIYKEVRFFYKIIFNKLLSIVKVLLNKKYF